MLRLLGTVAAIAVGMLLIAAGAASAEQWYATPDGEQTDCTKLFPCKAETALAAAGEGDEVILGSGTYELPTEEGLFSEVPGIYVHGDFSGPPPLIFLSAPEYATGMLLTGEGARAAYLEIETVGGEVATGFDCGQGGHADRIHAVARSTGFAGGIVASGSCEISNSVGIATGRSAFGVGGAGISPSGTEEMRLRNVTAVGFGQDSVGISVGSGGGFEDELRGTFILDALNTIALGGQADIKGTATYGPTFLRMANSNFDPAKVAMAPGSTFISVAGNQSTPPVFTNFAAGDLHEAPNSPTIEAGGSAGLVGPLALGGEARVIGPAPDIGAYETSRPAVVPVAALTGLSLSPRKFAAVNAGGAVISKKKGRKGAVGAAVSYTLTAPGAVSLTVERKTIKRVGRKHKKKVVFKPVKGGFSVAGNAGDNSFKFSGRIGSKALKPGSYRLVGSTGSSVKRAPFSIVRP